MTLHGASASELLPARCSKCEGGGFLSLAPRVAFCDCDMGRECRRVYKQQTEAPVSESPKSPVPHSPALILDGTLIADGVIQTPNEPEQNSPQLPPILELHRHKDGYISFALKDDDDFRPKYAVLASELEKYFPEFRDQLIKDSHVSINAGYRIARRLDRTGAVGVPAHRTDNLKYLCACYSDLDFYKRGLTFGAAFGTVIDYQDQKKIPPASIIVRSGRGLWLMWLLRDPKKPECPQAAFPEKIDLYLRVERAIAQWMGELAADAAATCAARYVRIPGSFHTGGEEFVRWWPQLKVNGERYTYTLDQLAGHFGLPATLPRPLRKAFTECARPNKRASGHRMLAFYRLRELRLLESQRGGFHQGCRSRAAFIYAKILRSSGFSRVDVLQHVTIMGKNCRPPLPACNCLTTVKSAFSRSRHTGIKDQTIADWLDISPEECEILPRRDSGQKNAGGIALWRYWKHGVWNTALRQGGAPGGHSKVGAAAWICPDTSRHGCSTGGRRLSGQPRYRGSGLHCSRPGN